MSNVIQVGDKMFFHPGYYLQEWLEEKNMSVEEFADKTNISWAMTQSLHTILIW